MASGAQDSFVHLHVHTEYSMLDGAARLDDLFARTAELGMGSIAMTDHGNVFGAYEFWAGAKKHGLKPIIGLEAYATPGTSRFERKRVRWNDGGGDDVSGSGAYTHMTLWAENTAGMHNLFRLSSRSSIEGFFYKPRLDRELLAVLEAAGERRRLAEAEVLTRAGEVTREFFVDRPRCRSRGACPACSRSATCAPARSSASPPRWARARRRCE